MADIEHGFSGTIEGERTGEWLIFFSDALYWLVTMEYNVPLNPDIELSSPDDIAAARAGTGPAAITKVVHDLESKVTRVAVELQAEVVPRDG